jgi:hypothetical protein
LSAIVEEESKGDYNENNSENQQNEEEKIGSKSIQ